MGYAIAEVFAANGAEVQLVSGPVELKTSHPGIELIPVVSAQEMYEACEKRISAVDIAIFSAAVADFAPLERDSEKIKRGKDGLTLTLKATPDIAAGMGEKKRGDQVFVGFALETSREIENARRKLEKKNLDLIVLNSLNDTGAGFGVDTNKVSIIDRQGKVEKYDLKSKQEVAFDIFEQVVKLIGHA